MDVPHCLTPSPKNVQLFYNFNTLDFSTQNKLTELIQILAKKLNLSSKDIFNQSVTLKKRIQNWQPLLRIFKHHEDEILNSQTDILCETIISIKDRLAQWLVQIKSSKEAVQTLPLEDLQAQIDNIKVEKRALVKYVEKTYKLQQLPDTVQALEIISSTYDISLKELKRNIDVFILSNITLKSKIKTLQKNSEELVKIKNKFYVYLNKLGGSYLINRKSKTEKQIENHKVSEWKIKIPNHKFKNIHQKDKSQIKESFSKLNSSNKFQNINNLLLQIFKKTPGNIQPCLDNLDEILFYVQEWPFIPKISKNALEVTLINKVNNLLKSIKESNKQFEFWNNNLSLHATRLKNQVVPMDNLQFKEMKKNYDNSQDNYNNMTKILNKFSTEKKYLEKKVTCFYENFQKNPFFYFDFLNTLNIVSDSHDVEFTELQKKIKNRYQKSEDYQKLKMKIDLVLKERNKQIEIFQQDLQYLELQIKAYLQDHPELNAEKTKEIDKKSKLILIEERRQIDELEEIDLRDVLDDSIYEETKLSKELTESFEDSTSSNRDEEKSLSQS